MELNFLFILSKLINSQNLSSEEMEFVFENMMNFKYTSAQISAVLVSLRMKGVTDIELLSAFKVLRSRMLKVSFDKPTPYLIDTCGTGGDHANFFNISTASAIVCAASGVFVAKHGNKSVSSTCGSANVLEALGIPLNASVEKMTESIQMQNIGFLYAIHYHPAMKAVSHVRQEIGQRTIFNLLGPLLNPAQVKRQVIGVFDESLLSLFANTLSHLNMEKVIVLHGHGSVDEVSLTGPTKYVEIKGNHYIESIFNPQDYGFSLCSAQDLQGGTVAENAQIILDVFQGIKIQGIKNPKKDIIVLNAGFGLFVSGLVSTLDEGFKLASKTIESGQALNKLNSWVQFLKQ